MRAAAVDKAGKAAERAGGESERLVTPYLAYYTCL
jgi:hypothetical protein